MDGLYLSGWARINDVLSDLEQARVRAAEERRGEHVRIGNEPFLIQPHGLGRYRYAAEHENALVAFSPGDKLPPIRVQLRAQFLHAVGARAALAWIRFVLTEAFRDVHLQVSRVDVFADWQGWRLRGEDRGRFVGWSTTVNTYEKDGRFCGLIFGRRAGAGIVARIYDKTQEIADKGGGYWFGVWGDAYAEGSSVVRVEFELGRTILRAFKLDDPEAVLDALPRVWAYLTDDWLSYRTPTEDETRSRWPVAPEWEAISHPSFRENAVGLERVKSERRTFDLRRILPPLVGYLASFGVLVGAADLSHALAELYDHARSYETRTGISFADRMSTKRLGLGRA